MSGGRPSIVYTPPPLPNENSSYTNGNKWNLGINSNDSASIGGQNMNFSNSGKFHPFPNSATIPSSPISQYGFPFNSQIDSFVQPIANFGWARASSMIQNRSSYLNFLKYYFCVSNGYVLNKLGILCFPFAHRSWSRRSILVDTQEVYYPPNEDVNSPDLYIPVISFITYVLLVACLSGFKYSTFKPDLLGLTSMLVLITWIIETAVIRLGFHLYSGRLPILDIFAFSGYKFVLLNILLISKWINNYLFYLLLLYASYAMGSFIIKTLRIVIPINEESDTNTLGRNHFLFFIGFIQSIILFAIIFVTV